MKELGAKEVYITEALGFKLTDLQGLRKAGLKLRVIPDIVQRLAGTKKVVPAILGFWIRPEDLFVYEKYVDTVEFFCRNDRLSVVYKIYRDGVWEGKLSDIIQDAEDLDICSNRLGGAFAISRLNCGKKCLFDERKCQLCLQQQIFAQKLEKAKITIERARDRKWRQKNESEINEDVMRT